MKGAQGKLRQFRKASLLAVAITGFLLLLLSPNDLVLAQSAEGAQTNGNGIAEVVPPARTSAGEEPAPPVETRGKVGITPGELSEASLHEARNTFQLFWDGLSSYLPKMMVALLALFLAWLVVAGIRWILRNSISRWEGSKGIIALTSILIWLVAIGIAVSVVTGDVRALVGSFGLLGLALSWSLQTPIESFTGWLLNSFKTYYKLGDRIQVGDVLGDPMKGPVQQYESILKRAGLTSGIPENPQVFVANSESWMVIIVRYLMGASERRKWKSELTLRITEELNKATYKNRIMSFEG